MDRRLTNHEIQYLVLHEQLWRLGKVVGRDMASIYFRDFVDDRYLFVSGLVDAVFEE